MGITPIKQAQSAVWQSVSAGFSHSAAIKNDGTLWAWGLNDFGQVGDGSVTNRYIPVQISTATNWQSVSVGYYYTLAIKSDGTLWGWGFNECGQLGDGTTNGKMLPAQIGTSTDWRLVSAGGGHSVAIKNDGTLWAWGNNAAGQLGDGTTTNRFSPVQIGSSTDWKSVSAGHICYIESYPNCNYMYEHTVAVKNNGTLWTWGYNSNGQLGDGSRTDRKSPLQIGTATNWQSVSAGPNYTVAIKNDGTLWAWGNNFSGQLGDGTKTEKTSPVQIGFSSNWQSVTSGHLSFDANHTNKYIGGHTVAIKSDGTLWAWGGNNDGQLGDGTTAEKNSPVQVGTSANWQSVSASNRYTDAIKNDGTLWTWGKISIGDGITIIKYVPKQMQFYVVTSIATNATISESLPKNVAVGDAVNFSISPNSGYYLDSLAGGTCPLGTFSGSSYTTGPIMSDCNVVFNALKMPVVTPSITNGNVYPSTPQSVSVGKPIGFKINANAGYYLDSTIGGTCPQGVLNANSYKTGPITTDCTVDFTLYKIPTCSINRPSSIIPYLQGGITTTIIGTASADPSLNISKVEISLDGGITWQTVSGNNLWNWSGTLPANGIIQARASDSKNKQSAIAYSDPITTSVLFYIKGTDNPMGVYGTYTLAMLNWSGSPISAVSADIANASGINHKITKSLRPKALAQLGKTLSTNYLNPTTMRINIVGANQTAIPDGDIAYHFMSIGAKLTSPAVYSPYSIPMILTPSATTPSGILIPTIGVPKTINAKLLADANNNNSVDIAEVQQTANQLLQTQPVSSSVDVNGDGIVTIGDLQLAINANLGSLKAVSSNQPPSATLEAELNFNPLKTTLTTGESITIPITLINNSGTGIAAASNHIVYDPTVFTVISANPGESAVNSDKGANYSVPQPGELIVAVYGLNTTPMANGIVANVTFRVLPTAKNGTYSFTYIPTSPNVADINGNLYQVTGLLPTFTILSRVANESPFRNLGKIILGVLQ